MVAKDQKHVAIFMHGLFEGGAERIMLNMAKGLVNSGHSVDLVLARADGPFLPQVPEEVRMIDLKSTRVMFSLRALTQYIQSENPDGMLSCIDYTNIIAILARQLVRKPDRLVVGEHNTFSQRITQLPFFYRRLLPKLVRLLYPLSDCVAAVSQGVANDLVNNTGIKPEHIRVINNPVITQDLQKKSQLPLEHPWFQPEHPPVLVSVGRLHPQKDFPNLLHAFAKVRQNRVARLVILGEGERRTDLEKLAQELGISDDISMPGFVDNPYSYMANSSVYVLSSKWEGLPTVLIEALYCGVPIVSTDCPSGPKEILQNGRFGLLVPVGDSEKLALAIEEALDGKVAAAPSISWEPYTVEHIVDQYYQALFGTK
jgi:glycosyltransferase involved in cell wall biosynthesis